MKPAFTKKVSSCLRHAFPIFALLFFPIALRAQLQVDCSGANPKAYGSISAALQNAGPGSTILVTGTCNETVTLQGVDGLNLGAWPGQTATVNGGVYIWDSKFVYLYGLKISNPAWDGIGVYHSTSVYVDTCTSNGNGAAGLAARFMSDVEVFPSGTFDSNGAFGIYIDTGSRVRLSPWVSTVDISNNGTDGVHVDRGTFETFGNTTVSSNGAAGIQMNNGRASVGSVWGPTTVQNNPSGGALIQEASEASFWNIFGVRSVFQGNGPTGISVGTGSQVSFALDGVQISDHTEVGVDVYGNSQANFDGPNSVLRNGTSSNTKSAGLRLDGNSEALIRGGDFSQNNGPAILGLVNSSVDFTGVTFTGNVGGIINCDSSATMISDLAQPGSALRAGLNCRTPHALGNHHINSMKQPNMPDLAPFKALQARYKKIATRH